MNPLRLTAVQKSFGSHLVVDIDSLDVAPGELVALLGPSGCGKSTTLRLIAGLERLDHGRIEVGGATVADDRLDIPAEKRNVGLVFQAYALFPHLTVAQNIQYGLRRSVDRRSRLQEMVDLVGLADYQHRHPRELSGGQQQRVALARALAPRPSLLLLDEPFSSLDPGLRQSIRSDMRDILRQTGITALLVTHDQEEAFSMADRVAVMMDGRIAQIDTPATVYQSPASPEVAAFVGDANLLPGTATPQGIHTPLGIIPHHGPHQGDVTVMIRPEMVHVLPDHESRGVPAVVRSVRYFGHDHLIMADLPDGQRIISRQYGLCQVTPGDPIRLGPGSHVMVYPAQP